MKRLRMLSRLGAVSLILTGTLPAFAATGLTGRWMTEVETPEGFDIPVNLTLRQDGNVLTGTVAAPATPPMNIQNGRVIGNRVFFTVSVNGMTVTSQGTVAGDEIRILSKPSDHTVFQDTSLTLKRSK